MKLKDILERPEKCIVMLSLFTINTNESQAGLDGVRRSMTFDGLVDTGHHDSAQLSHQEYDGYLYGTMVVTNLRNLKHFRILAIYR